MMGFTHLHVHTQYSILDGASSIPALMKKAKEDEMKAIAITDHGNLFGAKEFCNEAKSHSIKPIIGCEVYLARRSRFKNTTKEDRGGYHLILLAKNRTGYKNLVKLVSTGWIEGHYYKPRIDKEILKEYSEGLIASTACLGGDIPSQILNESVSGLETSLAYYQETFGDDFYLELQNHGIPEQKTVNATLIKLAEKNNLKVIATNDVHYINKEDYNAHDILIRLNTGTDINDKNEDLRYSGEEYLSRLIPRIISGCPARR